MLIVWLTVSDSLRIPRLINSLVLGSVAEGFLNSSSTASVDAPGTADTWVPLTVTSPFLRSGPNPILNALLFWRSERVDPGLIIFRRCVSGNPFLRYSFPSSVCTYSFRHYSCDRRKILVLRQVCPLHCCLRGSIQQAGNMNCIPFFSFPRTVSNRFSFCVSSAISHHDTVCTCVHFLPEVF